MSDQTGVSKIATALLGFATDAPPIHFDATNPHFGNKYASLAGIVESVRPALVKHGLVLVQQPCATSMGAPGLRTTLIHAESGEQISEAVPLVIDKQNMQGLGSALTYARRFGVLAILNLVADADDDANAASRATVPDRDPANSGIPGSAGNFEITFGTKMKGKLIRELDDGALDWLLGVEDAKGQMADAQAAAQAWKAEREAEDIPF